MRYGADLQVVLSRVLSRGMSFVCFVLLAGVLCVGMVCAYVNSVIRYLLKREHGARETI